MLLGSYGGYTGGTEYGMGVLYVFLSVTAVLICYWLTASKMHEAKNGASFFDYALIAFMWISIVVFPFITGICLFVKGYIGWGT